MQKGPYSDHDHVIKKMVHGIPGSRLKLALVIHHDLAMFLNYLQ